MGPWKTNTYCSNQLFFMFSVKIEEKLELTKFFLNFKTVQFSFVFVLTSGRLPECHEQCPSKKFYTEQMFVCLRTKRMQLRKHADTQIVKRSQR